VAIERRGLGGQAGRGRHPRTMAVLP
jgi:hypothetical protein